MKICVRIVFGAVLFTLSTQTGSDVFRHLANRGELLLSAVNHPHTFYTDRAGHTGFEYRLVKRFAESIGLSVRVITAKSSLEALRLLDAGKADMAAVGENVASAPNFFHLTTEPHTFAKSVAIYKSGKPRPKNILDLEKRRIVTDQESLSHNLRRILPSFENMISPTNATPKTLLDLVQLESADAAILNSIEFQPLRKLYPQLRIAFIFENEDIPIGWHIDTTQSGKALKVLADHFLRTSIKNGTITSLRRKSFVSMAGFSSVDAHTFDQRIRDRLPAYASKIQQAAGEFGLEWELLAAISYQESHWNPKAISPTGVRGMMMLTNRTAAELGIEKRTDTLESLRGGAEYFQELYERLPKDILEPDRTSFALAAYNIGMGHLEDARVITEKFGADPHIWSEVSRYLPFLESRKHYETTKYGSARGQEAVTYVKNINNYYQTLIWQRLITQDSRNNSQSYRLASLPPSISGEHWSAL